MFLSLVTHRNCAGFPQSLQQVTTKCTPTSPDRISSLSRTCECLSSISLNMLYRRKQWEDLCTKNSSNRSMKCIIKAIPHNCSVKNIFYLGNLNLSSIYILFSSEKQIPKPHKTAHSVQKGLLEK